MKRVAIIICNYNKKDYVKKNIEALLRQTVEDYDIYLVDNASTDGTADDIEATYPDTVRVLRNSTNAGGSGGFNLGMREARKQDYCAYLLLDNDVILAPDCLAQLLRGLDEHPRLGIEGAEILRMDEPDTIQEYGPLLDSEHVGFILRYRGDKDSEDLPAFLPCDYVPACAMLVRRETIDTIGLMPEENFIYYDDIEWCTRAREAGFGVAANRHAKAWHKGGAAQQTTTFSVYYLNRNKTAFFLRYFPDLPADEEAREAVFRHRADVLLRDMYQGCFVCQRNGQHNVLKTRMDAFIDALMKKTGKVMPYEIRSHEHTYFKRFRETFEKTQRLALDTRGDYTSTACVLDQLHIIERERGLPFDITLIDGHLRMPGRFRGRVVLPKMEERAAYDFVLEVCPHVYDLKVVDRKKAYVDRWRNLLISEADFASLQEYRRGLMFFRLCYLDRLMERMEEEMTYGRCAKMRALDES